MTTDPANDRLLIVGPSWVGDMVMTHSLVLTLRERSPGVVIDMLAPGWSLPIIARMPEIRDGIEMPLGHGEFGFGRRRRLGRSLAANGYDRAIVLPRSFKAALVPFFARIPVRTGFRGEMRFGLINDMRTLDKTVLTQTVRRFVTLGLPARATPPETTPAPRLAVDEAKRRELVNTLGLQTDRPVIGFMPGAEYGSSKCWPLEYYAELAGTICRDGGRVWIFGSDKDRAAGGQIGAGLGEDVVNLCGKTRLEDVIDLMSVTRAAVTNDSGLMHVAAAVGTHVIAVYGSTTDAFTPPLTERKTVVRLGIDCSPCFERECPLGHHRCMRDITVRQVYEALPPDTLGSRGGIDQPTA